LQAAQNSRSLDIRLHLAEPCRKVRGGVDGYFGDPVSNELMSHQGEEEVTVRSPSWQNVDWRNPTNKKKI